jgi:glutamate 5-kinase
LEEGAMRVKMPRMSDNIETSATRLAAASRIVVKAGSALLIGADGALLPERLSAIAAGVAALRTRGSETILVTSGAIAAGRHRLKLSGALKLAEKQAAAAAGQAKLIESWQDAFEPHGLIVAQLLLTLDDTENRRRYLNARATIRALLDLGAVPVINENDTVATSEIRYGDNDRLSAHAAQMAGADLLILLSDVDGLYTADPRKDGSAAHIPVVEAVTPEIERMAGAANAERGVGSGGMATKIAAAKIATAGGCAVIIADGSAPNPIEAVAAGSKATLFKPRLTPDRARRAWIGGRLKPAGSVIVDAGAAAALKRGASLLPAGIRKVEGQFKRGDAVAVIDDQGAVVGQGLSAYDAEEVLLLMGKKTPDIEKILGYRGASAVIHRDDLALRGGNDGERAS